MINSLCRSWVDKKYGEHMKTLLFETEKARCPENIEEAANYRKVKPLRLRNAELHEKMLLLRTQMNAIEAERNAKFASIC